MAEAYIKNRVNIAMKIIRSKKSSNVEKVLAMSSCVLDLLDKRNINGTSRPK